MDRNARQATVSFRNQRAISPTVTGMQHVAVPKIKQSLQRDA